MSQSAIILNGPRRGQRLTDPDAITAALNDDELAWVHLQADAPEAADWVAAHLPLLDPQGIDALLAQDTRPRFTPIGGGALVILRGINTNEGAEPEDMVSLRLWLDPRRIVTASLRPLKVLDETAADISAGKGPEDAGAFLAHVTENLTGRIEDFSGELEQQVDTLEIDVLDEPDADLREGILNTRQDVIQLRRFAMPQRDALGQAGMAGLEWLDRTDLRRLSEVHDRLTRTVENLDAMRDRLAVIRDELHSSLSDRLNRNLYMLSVISAVFLPLGFLTGLMGVNLAGMPGAGWAPAFWVFALSLLALALGIIGVLRVMKWL